MFRFVAFTKKNLKEKDKGSNKASTQPSGEYCSVRKRIILIL